MVIVRNPGTAEFGSMPSNAIVSGAMNYVLEPELMPAVIEDYVKQELDVLTENKNDSESVSEILNLINQPLTLDFSDYKQITNIRRIKRRAKFHNFNKLEDYIDLLKSGINYL